MEMVIALRPRHWMSGQGDILTANRARVVVEGRLTSLDLYHQCFQENYLVGVSLSLSLQVLEGNVRLTRWFAYFMKFANVL